MNLIGFEQNDSHIVLFEKHCKLPSIISQYITKDLDFHQREHLSNCEKKPLKWKEKSLRMKIDNGSISSSTKILSEIQCSPDVISINLTWNRSEPKDVLSTLNTIPSIFSMSELCKPSERWNDKQYYFKGMIWYWGAHYFCYIRHITNEGEIWIEYNDKNLYKIPSWKWLVEDCVISWCKFIKII